MNIANRLIAAYLLIVSLFVLTLTYPHEKLLNRFQEVSPVIIDIKDAGPDTVEPAVKTTPAASGTSAANPYESYLSGAKKLGVSLSFDLCENVLYRVKNDFVDEINPTVIYTGIKNEVSSLLKCAGVDSSELKNMPDGEEIFTGILTSYGDKVDRDLLFYACLKGMVKGTADRHSDFLTPEEYTAFVKRTQEESYSGIGIRISKPEKSSPVEIIEVFDSGPAYAAGIRKGDVIIGIDQTDIIQMTLNQISELLRGKENSKVKLAILRESEKLSFDVPRRKMKMRAVQGRIINNKIGYIRIDGFKEEINGEFRQEYEKMANAGIKGLILDLRNNPGGLVIAARDLCGCFLPRDTEIATFKRRGDEKRKIYTSGRKIVFVPVIILINPNTASSAEITAGALKDHGVAKLLGEKSRGKGSVQRTVRLEGGCALKLTIEKIFTPSGFGINAVGLSPDIEVATDYKKMGTAEDAQLDRAVKVLSE
ncbi:MAG: S41 family peptidase [Firmicutes bacterium]|nr:S41 family peptidase [Bacillota bacterium]